MIFVTVGTQKFQFDRLVKAVDELAGSGKLSENIFAQTGNCEYVPRNIGFTDFLSNTEFETYLDRCDIIITHGGAATIVKALKKNKRVIVVPRKKAYGEHVDDHQVQIAWTFEERNLIIQCRDICSLPECIEEAKVHTFTEYHSERMNMISTIEDFLDKN